MIRNHSPANLNRGDPGARRTSLFGGVTRARISSQCLKRSIRRSAAFQTAMEKDGGVRTRRLITLLAERAHGASPAPEDLIGLVARAFARGRGRKGPMRGDLNPANLQLFVPGSAIAAMGEAVTREWARRKPDPRALAEALAECLGGKAAAPGIALCGRMAERDAEGPFRMVGSHVAPALSAAHAISTHEVVSEVNSLAAEGLPAGRGAGDISEARRASVCSYTYFCVDWQQLVENLNGDAELAKRTVRQFLYAAATSTPPGRQSSFAPFSLPEGILVEVKTEPAVPMSYVNAFAEPVPRNARRGLIEESIARLGEHVRDMASGYGFPAERFWFSPSGRYPLTGVEDRTERTAADGIESTGSFEILVDAVVEAVEAQA